MSPQLCITFVFLFNNLCVFSYKSTFKSAFRLSFKQSEFQNCDFLFFFWYLVDWKRSVDLLWKQQMISIIGDELHVKEKAHTRGGGVEKPANKLSHRSVSSAFPISLFLACMSFSLLYSIYFTKLSSTDKSNLSSFFIWIETQSKEIILQELWGTGFRRA